MTTHLDNQRLTTGATSVAALSPCRRRIDGNLPYATVPALVARCAR